MGFRRRVSADDAMAMSTWLFFLVGNHECHDEDSRRRETLDLTTIMLGVHRASSGGICRVAGDFIDRSVGK